MFGVLTRETLVAVPEAMIHLLRLILCCIYRIIFLLSGFPFEHDAVLLLQDSKDVTARVTHKSRRQNHYGVYNA